MGNTEVKQANSGLRIVGITLGSPAQLAGLTEFLDFILDISGNTTNIPLPAAYLNPTPASNEKNEPEDNKIILLVYNILHRKTRAITIERPAKTDSSQNLLGFVAREEEYINAHERVLRVSKVYSNSPAAESGLNPDSDYIIGSHEFRFQDISDFATYVVLLPEGKGFSAFVYNSDGNNVREINIVPNKNWGGKGSLGCEFAGGIMNHLPTFKEDTDKLKTSHDSELQVIVSEGPQEESNTQKEDIDELSKEKTSLQVLDDLRIEHIGKEGSFGEVVTQGHRQEERKEFSEGHASPFSQEVGASHDYDHDDNKQSTPLFKIEPLDKSPSSGTPNSAVQSNVQLQKASGRLVPKPHLKVQHADPQASNSLTGIPDISPIPKKSSLVILGTAPNSRNVSSQMTKRAKASSVTQPMGSQPASPYGWSFAEKDESQSQKQFNMQSSQTRIKARKSTDGSQKGDKAHSKHDDVVEVYFQGIERIEHVEDEIIEFPKVLMTNPQDLTNINTTLLDKSGGESQNKSLETAETYEKPVCKTVVQYTFHSKKLGGDYIIKSTDLFSIGDFRKMG